MGRGNLTRSLVDTPKTVISTRARAVLTNKEENNHHTKELSSISSFLCSKIVPAEELHLSNEPPIDNTNVCRHD